MEHTPPSLAIHADEGSIVSRMAESIALWYSNAAGPHMLLYLAPCPIQNISFMI